jgi:transcriptional regulator with XRE-family HTH domain
VGKIKWYATAKMREWREYKGYTQQEATDLFNLETGGNISVSAYQQWETGVLNLQPEQVLEMARFMRLTYKELVEQKENGSQQTAAAA